MLKPISVVVVGLVLAAWGLSLPAAEYNTSAKKTPLITWTGKADPFSQSKLEPTALAKVIDHSLTEDLAASDDTNKVLTFSKRASDEVFLRRVYLDFIGHNPTADEVTTFVLDPAKDKRDKLIVKLLDDPRFGENWGRYWRDVIMYRRQEDRAMLVQPALTDYLTEQFNKNTPWDAIARSFMTADGDVKDNGATGIIMAQNGMTSDITSEISRIFLGVQIQCANCHDHKTDRWKREQFHQLAAFFPRVALKPDNAGEKRTFVVSGNDNPIRRVNPKMANRPVGSPEHFMPDLKHPESEGTKMQPVFFLTGQNLPFGTPDAQRRETIAKWITDPRDEWFAKAFVNRIWAELVGEGFYNPIDDLGPDRTCSAPKTMEILGHEFADSRFDIKRLFHIIADTEAYQRDSRSRRKPDEMPFAANCPERLRGDEVYDALVSALGANEDMPALRFAAADGAKGGKAAALLRSPRNQFDQVFGYDPSAPRDEVTGSIPQALLMMNGPQINRAITGFRPGGGTLGQLLNSTSDNEAVATELYLRCLGREPNKAELQTCVDHVKKTSNRTTGFEDVLWALINSTEFLQRR
ncbi:MAG TPA: DUF1549 domain-containing protein [Pirellulales bacterium]|jgi:hypothetical protein|nr:DUF1549 domain-containing protein [Pirellulales bacterium]